MAAPLPASVSVRGVTKRYGAVTALGGVDLEVPAGSIFGLLGPNGAGKTTLLECILGLRSPDAGSISLEGVDALRHPEKTKAFVGAQLQEAALQDKITPRQALRLFASFHDAPVATPELLQRFALAEKADQPFESLSGGQKQRLFLALAFVNRPRLVVLDEPTAGLDPRARRDLHACIRDLREAGCTVLMSTHDLAEAALLCDCIGILDRGLLVARGSPAELVTACSASPRIAFRTGKALTQAGLDALPGVTEAHAEAGRWILSTRNPNLTVAALVAALGQAPLEELEIQRPSLEDVFFEHAGRPWGEKSVP